MKTYKDAIFSGKAKYFLSAGYNRGWLYLTQERLIFIGLFTAGSSWSRSGDSYKIEIPLSNIVNIKLSISKERMILNAIDGKRERFMMNNRKEWIEQICRVRPIEVR